MGDMAKDFLAGGAGGLCLLAVGHPFDTVKVRVQTQPELYKSTSSAIKLTLAKEGPFAFYRGVGALIPGIAPVFALSFMGYGHGKQIFGDQSISQLALAGAWSAVYTTPLIAPGERIKCVAQTTHKYGSSVGAVAKNLYAEGGIKTIFKGSGMTLGRDGFGSALYFGSYETLKQNYMKKHNLTELPILFNLLFGGLAGWSMWAVVMPLDVVKSRLQTAPEGVTQKAMLNKIKAEIRTDGIKTVYRGIGVTLARAFPANAACFLGYEQAKKALNKIW